VEFNFTHGSKIDNISYDITDFVKAQVLNYIPTFPPITKSIVLFYEFVTKQA